MLRKSLLCAISITAASITSAQEMPSMDDFLPPASNPKAQTEVKQPDKVKVTEKVTQKDGRKTPVVEAASTQDAINATREKQEKREFNQPCALIKVGSGGGVVCTGTSEYSKFENRNATLLSQRRAYVKAYMVAKKELASFLYGMSNKSVQELKQSFDMYDDEKDSLANVDDTNSENIGQFIQGMIRGFTVYDIKDDSTTKTVSVTIVTTPQTRGETLQVNRTRIAAKDIASGVKKVFAELKTGILPPEGAKVISVPGTNLIYFISFGSEIIHYNRNQRLMRKLKQNAIKTAKLRAADNMCKLIIGDNITWSGGTNTQGKDSMKQFEDIFAEDPTSENKKFEVKGFDKDRASFVQRQKDTESFRSASEGKLPPGLQPITWTNGDWAYCAYVYNPDQTALAKDIAKDMKNNSILKNGNSTKGHGTSSGADKAASRRKATEENNRKEIKPIESGRITKDEDL